jgi:hypothetical protein
VAALRVSGVGYCFPRRAKAPQAREIKDHQWLSCQPTGRCLEISGIGSVVLSRSVIVSIRMPLIVRRVLSSEMERIGRDLPEVENLRPIIRIDCFSCMLQSGSQDGRSSFDDDG